jgi:hypothetical protein
MHKPIEGVYPTLAALYRGRGVADKATDLILEN